MLSFGVIVLPDPPHARLIDLLQRAEANGFECGWTYDAHILWQESFALLPLAAAATTPLEAPRHHDEPVVSADLSDPPGAAPPHSAGVHHHPARLGRISAAEKR